MTTNNKRPAPKIECWCEICGKSFLGYTKKAHTCSPECRRKWNILGVRRRALAKSFAKQPAASAYKEARENNNNRYDDS